MFNAFKEPKKHCKYFKYLSIISSLMSMLLVTISVFLMYKKQSQEYVVTFLIYALFYALSYFQNRLLYTMCKK